MKFKPLRDFNQRNEMLGPISCKMIKIYMWIIYHFKFFDQVGYPAAYCRVIRANDTLWLISFLVWAGIFFLTSPACSGRIVHKIHLMCILCNKMLTPIVL